MMLPNAPARCRRGFTLIELLTVVAIISLLIGILLPSLSKARDQAKKVKVLGMLNSIDKALEMFHNDFDKYPDSSQVTDPIDWTTAGYTGTPMVTATSTCHMSGAHWLARALVGHDFKGVDGAGLAMGTAPVTYDQLMSASRKGVYFEGKVFFRDDDIASGLSRTATATISDFEPTGRMVVTDDAFKSPILYYRANERAAKPFSNADTGGVYRHGDNALITGIDAAGAAPLGWDFAGTGKRHQIAPYSFQEVDPLTADNINGMPANFTNTFCHYLFNVNALTTSGGMTIRPMNPDRFILMSAGKDGIFGTDDDINNFTAR